MGDFVGDPTRVDNGYGAGYFHGFIPSTSKGDNFKVRKRGSSQLPCLKVIVFKDRNANGFFDADAQGRADYDLPETEVVIADPSGAFINGPMFTGYEGAGLTVCNLIAGTYRISATAPAGMYLTGGNLDGVPITYTDHVDVTMGTKNRTLYIGMMYVP